MRVRNKSEAVQMFTSHPPFEPGEVREVSDSEGEILCRSPFMEEATESVKGTDPKKSKSMKGVETE